MTTPIAEIRSARVEDLSQLADFIAHNNKYPAHQSFYCTAGTASAVRTALRNTDDFPRGWERSFVIARTGGEFTAAVGCQLDPGQTSGWLWGPWVAGGSRDWSTVAPSMLSRLLVLMPALVHGWEVFLNAENRDGLHFLQSEGFHLGPVTHIYVLSRQVWRPPDDRLTDCPYLRPAHEVAFAHLHADTFPAGGSTSADDLLAGRDDEHIIFAAADGLRLLGYVCASINRAPREGFIDYLAVKPSARGRGIGVRLLQAALRRTFAVQHLPQAALCVSEWRDGARQLYERVGFTLSGSGIGARRQIRQKM